MNKQNIKNGAKIAAQVIIGDIRAEIDLNGLELLKFEFEQPETSVMCTGGALWLTQPGDPHDHVIKAGQSFRLHQRGTVLVQGLPCGKARILESGRQALYN